MLTYELEKSPGLPLYESLYRCIREDIRRGRLSPNEKLPSKRSWLPIWRSARSRWKLPTPSLCPRGICARWRKWAIL